LITIIKFVVVGGVDGGGVGVVEVALVLVAMEMAFKKARN